jgi:phage-related holin
MSALTKLFAVLKSYFIALVGVSWIAPFFLPIRSFLLTAALLVIFDSITGILAAKKRGEKVTSRGFSRMISKMLVYFSAILAAAAMQSVFFSDSKIEFLPNLPLVYLVSASICVTEFLSLRENAEAITGVDILGGLKKNLSKLYDAIPRKVDNN